ncbi:Chitin synthase, class 3 [Actinomortierella ambigua]|nr:Chitin synthase, class 3 [Actinomortierella ambigua]
MNWEREAGTEHEASREAYYYGAGVDAMARVNQHQHHHTSSGQYLRTPEPTHRLHEASSNDATRRYPSRPTNRNSGLSIVTSPSGDSYNRTMSTQSHQPFLHNQHGAGLGVGEAYYHSQQNQRYMQDERPRAVGSYNPNRYTDSDRHHESSSGRYAWHDDSGSGSLMNRRRPPTLRQYDLEKDKAERMEKRKKARKPKKDDKESRCKGNSEIQQAWREKVALVIIIFLLCLAVGFLTFGFNVVLCGKEPSRIRHGHVSDESAVLLGRTYLLKDFNHPPAPGIPVTTSNLLAKPFPNAGGRDMSFMFQKINQNCKDIFIGKQHDEHGNVWNYFPCAVTGSSSDGTKPLGGMGKSGCHVGPTSIHARQLIKRLRFMGEVYFSWEDLEGSNSNYAVYNGNVLDLNRLHWLEDNIIIQPSFYPFMNGTYAGKDITLSMSFTKYKTQMMKCFVDTIKVGVIDQLSLGCVISDIVLYVSLIVILSVVLLRFFLAVIFGWVLSWRLGSFDEKTFADKLRRQEIIEAWVDDNTSPYVDSPNSETNRRAERIRANVIPNSSGNLGGGNGGVGSENNTSSSNVAGATEIPFPLGFLPPPARHWDSSPSSPKGNGGDNNNNTNTNRVGHPATSSIVSSSMPRPNGKRSDTMPIGTGSSRLARGLNASMNRLRGEQPECPLLHTLMLVTCYSEGVDGLRATCDSLANTSYPSTHKLLLIIADGLIRGEGGDRTTPDICLDMMTDFIVPRDEVEAQSYIAIADGTKRHNMAKIYAGYYKYAEDTDIPPEEQQRVPMIVIVKCGTPEEKHEKKPGNRGKRDSQIILMAFLQKVMFDERMTPFEYEFFNAMWNVTKVTPDFYELVLMVDADTKVYPDSLTRLVACMAQDATIMGLCGETKIANKKETWVSMIQVFEYYISHHLSKAFESIFGGVTCLPGCFCMYRIKAPKGPNRFWVPILANPDIVENYSENVVDTLHKKNLLLLGEDRYLTTLMLRTFPKRKMMFVPQAVCKTQVPTSFPVLLSQRRRWINSTIHNLMELVLIRDLCGTFCFSMQFVIFMELVGTVVLPAAISFTMYLIVISFIITPVPLIPLLLLAAILGLPAILILMTSRKVVYVGWMFMYLISLPIWNFVLPAYAFWHFDDFTWGQTRKIQGEDGKDHHGSKEGEFDSSKIVMKRWCEFERDKRVKLGLTNGVQGWYQSQEMLQEPAHPMSTYPGG